MLVTLSGIVKLVIEQPKNAFSSILVTPFGIANAPVFAMGDYGNDITLLKVADFSGCPSTAIDEVKAVADIICKPVGEGAVAEFISVLREKYLV